MGIMEKNLETTIGYWSYIGFRVFKVFKGLWGLYRGYIGIRSYCSGFRFFSV